MFSLPNGGLSITPDGQTVVVADSGNNKIKLITLSTGEVVTLAGSGTRGFQDGVGSAAQFATPSDVAVTPDGAFAVVADRINHLIRLVSLADGNTSTLAGQAGEEGGYQNGIGAMALFNLPDGVSVTPNGQKVVVADSGNHRIRLVSLTDGETTLLAGSGEDGHRDGAAGVAMFNSPSGVSVTPNGLFVVVADRRNDRVRLVDIASGSTTTISGSGSPGAIDGPATRARFNSPYEVHVASDGQSVIIADFGNTRLRILHVVDQSFENCTCNEGHAGDFDVLGCTACAEGKYKNFSGPGECFSCPASAPYSEQSSASVYNCSCYAGFQLDGPMQLTCSPCAGGTYKDVSGAGPCSPCPDPNSHSPPGSLSPTACLCNAGFTGPDGGLCSACAVGTFKNESGAEPCVACNANAVSAAASVAIDACLCMAGYTGAHGACSACGVGTYKDSVGSAACTACPVDVGHAEAGSVAASNCTCNFGYEGDGSMCSPCLEGTYRDAVGPGSCEPCPANTSSPPGSANMSDCACMAGLTLSPGGKCVPCPTDTYKDATGDGGCSACPPNSGSSAGGATVDSCTCNPGYQPGASGACLACPRGQFKLTQGDEQCLFCGQNQYKDSLGPGACVECSTDGSRVSATGSTSAANCTCNVGFEPHSESCRACPAGKYKDFVGDEACSVCRDANAISVNGSADARACQCIAGFEEDAPESCRQCPEGFFKGAAGPGPCSPCQAHASSAPGSLRPDDCFCLPGYILEEGACVACPADAYRSEGACLQCPNGTTALAASAAIEDCVCRLGYTAMPASEACRPCANGTYKDTLGPADCTACPDANAVSAPGSAALAACRCSEGFTGPDGGNCTACPAGTYKNETGAAPCEQCSDHSWSAPRTTAAEGCQCDAGYSGPDGGVCVACAGGTFKGANGSTACDPCPAHRAYSPPASVDLAQCTCDLGYQGNGTACSACPSGFYKDFTGPGDCLACPHPGLDSNASSGNHSVVISSPVGSTSVLSCTCVPGMTPSARGGVCVDCAAGTFKPELSNGNCSQCPANSFSPAGSASAAACTCNAGYQRGPAGVCELCGVGRFKLTQGDEECGACPPHTYKDTLGEGNCTACSRDGSRASPEGSPSFDNCTCNLGYDGDILGNCLACTSGTYKDVVGAQACSVCPDMNAVTERGSTHILNCTCPAGFTGENAGSCAICAFGTYKELPGNGSCLACPAETPASRAGSEFASDCVCGVGYQLNATGVCVPCPLGTYKTVLGTQRCTLCPQDTFKATPGPGLCTPCSDDGTQGSAPGSTSSTDCACNLGFEGTTLAGCVPCSPGTYKDGIGGQACTPCPGVNESSLPGSVSSAACLCKPGHASDADTGECVACALGTYKESLADEACLACPVNSSSPRASDSLHNCSCNAGFEVDDPDQRTCAWCPPGSFKISDGPEPCSLCAPNTYKDAAGPGACSPCANNSVSLPGSDDALDCQCAPGYIGPDGGPCEACAPATFKAGRGDGVCQPCPAASSSVAGSGSLLECVCERGYTGANGTACSACPGGTYKGEVGPGECLPCAAHADSPNAAASSAGCLCNAGYTGPDGGPCTACEAGTYKNESGNGECSPCSEYAVSPEASTSSSQCLCRAGYELLGEECRPCAEYLFKLVDGDEMCRVCPRGTLKDWEGPGECSVPYWNCPGDVALGPNPVGDIQEGPSGIVDCFALDVFPNSDTVVYTEGNSINLFSISTQTTQVLAGVSDTFGYQDGTGASARFDMPTGGVAVTPDSSSIVVADTRNNRIRLVSAIGGVTTTLAGSLEGMVDGTGTDALFRGPADVAVDPDGAFVVVADRLNHRIRVVDLQTGVTTTLAGSATNGNVGGYMEGAGTEAQFKLPDAVALTNTASGQAVVVADTGNHRVRLVSVATGETTLLAGSGEEGFRDGIVSYAMFYSPSDVSMTSDGLFAIVTDRRNDVVRLVNMRDGYTSTLVGSGITGFRGGNASVAQFDNLYSSALTPDGLTLVMADTSNERLRLVNMLDVTSSCECNTGFTGTISSGCVPCVEGTYKDFVGDGTCAQCPVGRPVSRTASQDESRCTCDVGYTGLYPSDCVPCPADTYKDVTGSMNCFACPDHSLSGEGSIAEVNCTCDMGFTGPDGGPCRPCPSGTFKNVSGPGGCLPCMPNTFSDEGTTGLQGCLCNAGYTGGNGADCQPCEQGTYKALSGSAACSACPEDRGHSPEGSSTQSNCTCNYGYEGDGTACTACPEGKYKDYTGPGACWSCPDPFAYTTAGATSLQDCACIAGYALDAQLSCQECAIGTYKESPGFSVCEPCAPNTYKDAAGPGACSPCANNSVSLPGSDDALDCQCAPGYIGPDGGPCEACAPATFKAGRGDGVCQPCPAASSSVAGSGSLLECVCERGYTGANGTACSACPGGTYKGEVGPGECLPCAAHADSPNAAASSAGCLCNAGYTGPDGGPCTACEAGTYKNESGSMACTACLSRFALTNPASTNPDDCQCFPGYERIDLLCSPCAKGFFKHEVGDQACELCPASTIKDFIGPGNCSFRYFSCPADDAIFYAHGVSTAYDQLGAVESLTLTGDGLGLVYILDNAIHLLVGATADAVVEGDAAQQFLAGHADPGYQDSTLLSEVRFNLPGGVAAFGDRIFVADTGNHVIRSVLLVNGSTTTLAGSGVIGFQDGAGSSAAFSGPADVAVDPAGAFLVVADRLNHRIRMVSLQNGTTTTLSGSGSSGDRDGLGTLAQFNMPEAVAVTPDGQYVVVADTGNHLVRLVSIPAGEATVLAGTGEQGFRDGPSWWAMFNSPSGVSVTPSGRGLFALVTDRQNHRIRAVALRDGETLTLFGSEVAGFRDGNATVAQFDSPASAAITADGLTVVVADAGNARLRVVDVQDLSSTCQCNAGFSGDISSGCVPCAEGTYKETVGADACLSCPAPPDGLYFSYTASPSFANCTCVEGETLQDATTCGPCAAGTFKEYPGSQVCTDCPPNSFSPSEGSISISNCSCDAGYTGAAGECVACREGTYKNTSGPALCAECPANSLSPLASTALINCTCLPGFVGDDGQACTACPAGSFKRQPGQGECEICPSGTYSPSGGSSECTPCPDRSPYSPPGSDRRDNCSCFEGFQFNARGACIKCPEGKFKTEPGPQDCETCEEAAPGSTSLAGATSILNCTCNVGYFGEDAQPCAPCAPGTYKDFTGPGECTSCPFPNTTTPPGSSGLASCVCEPGNQGLGIGPCQACVPGKYKSFAGTAPCDDCPANSNSFDVGARVADNCLCEPGYTGTDGNCSACSVGTYKGSFGSAECTACTRALGYSPQASTDIRDCICNLGFQGLTDYDCRACPSTFYKDFPGQGNCIPCPDPNSNSSVASPSVLSCLCDPGFTGPDGGPCRMCESGTYKPLPGSQNCSLCADENANNTRGATAATDCLCLPGYSGPDGGNCTACPGGTYKGVAGSSACVGCPIPNRVYTPPASTSVEACICQVGFTSRITSRVPGVNGSDDVLTYSTRCFACAANTFKDVPGDARCEQCQDNSQSSRGSIERADCKCNEGYTAGVNDTCVPCASGTYKNFTGPDECVACPASAPYSGEGSPDVMNCSCQIGFEELQPQICTPCREKTYKSEVGPGPCTPCPDASFSPAGSTSHADCTCDVGFTGEDCSACPEGTYKDDPGPQECDPCPNGFNYSAPGSVSVDNCTCGFGFEGNGSRPCTPCAAGQDKRKPGYGVCVDCEPGSFKLLRGPQDCQLCAIGSYKPDGGTGSCFQCPNGSSYSPRGSIVAGNCTCDFGWGGNGSDACYPCPAMTYKNYTGPGTCLPCMDNNSFSEPASALCECNIGYSGPDGGACSPCPEGFFKLPGWPGALECAPCAAGSYRNETGPGNCTLCPDAFSTSLPGSTDLGNCECNRGYTGPDGGPCSPCPVGTHKNFTGSDPCVACPDTRAYSPQASLSILACTCPPGFTIAHENTTNCSACAAGFYKEETGEGPCSRCLPNSGSPSASELRTNCTCNAGWTGPDGGNCTACPERSYKLLRGSSECVPCTNNSYSPANSTSILYCQCVPGYTGDTVSGDPCLPCAESTYKEEFGNDECLPCPVGADYSLKGSVSLDNCTCNAGFFRNHSHVCAPCDADTYKDELGLFNCSLCPDPYQHAPPGSISVTNCSCNFGYVGLDGVNCTICAAGSYKVGSNPGVCELCPAGTYQDQMGSESCKICPDMNHTSSPGSMNITDCICAPGYSGVPGINCSACPVNTYKEESGNQPCQPCPDMFQISGEASTMVANCSCLPGFSGPDGGNCTACPARTYKSLLGDFPCLECTNSSYSPPNSTSLSACECIKGFSGETVLGEPCLPCEESSYKDFVGHGSCRACPARADFSLAGSVSVDNCTCNLGFTHDRAGRCAPCDRGTYKDEYGFANCTECPDPSSSSPIASADVTFCACNAGYVGPNGGSCTICPIGTYKFGTDPGVCTACPLGTYQASPGASACTACPDASHTTLALGSTVRAQCLCVAGYTGPAGGNCSACPIGTYKNATGTQACALCVAAYGFSEEASVSALNCTCARGFGEIGTSGCEPCRPGTYKATVGRANCTRCPDPNSYSDEASPSLESCVCNAGYYGPDGGPCEACSEGTYKPHPGSEACTECPPNSDSGVASTALAGCLCNAGYTGSGNNCTACEIGKFKNVSGSSRCLDCPIENRGYSDPGAVNASLCLCERGYTAHPDPASEQCVPCEERTFKFFEGNGACMACPTHSWSPERSYFPWDCKCNVGYTGGLRDGDSNEFIATLRTCDACAEGTYKNFTGPLRCINCPASAVYSPPGSALESNCSCDIGFEELAPLACAACTPGTYKSEVGPDACSPCPSNSFSPPGSSSALNCTCDVGYEGLGCLACAEGKYKNVTGTGLCVPCPQEFNYSAPASDSVEDCTCGVGLTGSLGAGCVPCPAGTFKHLPGLGNCSECPDANSHAPPRSTGPSRCACNAGYTGPDGGPCTPCAPGTYKNESGAGACQPCAAGQYKDFAGPGACVACPLGNALSAPGSSSVTACNCSVGYEGDVGGSCRPCAAGAEKLVAGFGNCTDCQPGSFKLLAGGDTCAVCPVGTHKAWAGAGACVTCPAAAGYSPAGSLSALNCTCDFGWGGADAGSCFPCPSGSFKTTSGPGTCTPCAANFTDSLQASVSADACQCIEGYEGNLTGGSCTPCPPGTFKGYFGAGACEPCPSGTYKNESAEGSCVLCPAAFAFSLPGSVSLADCTCNVGYGGDEGACQQCEAGTYKDHVGRGACRRCPHSNSFSPNASTHVRNCTCNAGFEGDPGEACSLCQVGTSKDYWGAGSCQACPDGTLPGNARWLTAGSAAASAPPSAPCGWECNAGFFHQDPLGEATTAQPNTCKQCSEIPLSNPCGPGEYYSTLCTTGEPPACRTCTNLVGPGSYLWPNPAWTLQDCPYACPQGYYAEIGVQDPLIWYPYCLECPAPGDSTCPGPCGLGAGFNSNTDCSL